MITIKQEDLLHKFQLLKLLIAIVDSPILSQNLYFKGGTCAALAGFLDRFSVDLDFDLKDKANKTIVKQELEKLFEELNYTKEGSKNETLFFVLKYKSPQGQRNTLKISAFEEVVKANDYKVIYIPEIDRLVNCQTIETMFANKLVAPLDRFKKKEKVAGRDIYDIHYFFLQGYGYKKEVIEERTGLKAKEYLVSLAKFIDEKISEEILTKDLNTLLPYEKFRKVRKYLKQEVLLLLNQEILRFEA